MKPTNLLATSKHEKFISDVKKERFLFNGSQCDLLFAFLFIKTLKNEDFVLKENRLPLWSELSFWTADPYWQMRQKHSWQSTFLRNVSFHLKPASNTAFFFSIPSLPTHSENRWSPVAFFVETAERGERQNKPSHHCGLI